MEILEEAYQFCRDEQRIVNATLSAIIFPIREKLQKKFFKSEIAQLTLTDAENKCYERIARQICMLLDVAEVDGCMERIYAKYPDSHAALQCLGIDDDTIEGLVRIRGLSILELTRKPHDEVRSLLTHYQVPVPVQEHALLGLDTIRHNCDAVINNQPFLHNSRQLIGYIARLMHEPSVPLPEKPPPPPLAPPNTAVSVLSQGGRPITQQHNRSGSAQWYGETQQHFHAGGGQRNTSPPSSQHHNHQQQLYFPYDSPPSHDLYTHASRNDMHPNRSRIVHTSVDMIRSLHNIPGAGEMLLLHPPPQGGSNSHLASPPPQAAPTQQQQQQQSLWQRLMLRRSSVDDGAGPHINALQQASGWNNKPSVVLDPPTPANAVGHHVKCDHIWSDRRRRALFHRNNRCILCEKKIKNSTYRQCEVCNLCAHKQCLVHNDTGKKGKDHANQSDTLQEQTKNYLRATTSSPAFENQNDSNSSYNSSTPESPNVSVNSPLTPRSTPPPKQEFVFPANPPTINTPSAETTTTTSVDPSKSQETVERRKPSLLARQQSTEQSEPMAFDPRLGRMSSMSMSMADWEIPFDRLVIRSPITRGNFGRVHIGWWHGDVVIKMLNLDEEDTSSPPVAGEVEEEEEEMTATELPSSSSNHSVATPVNHLNTPTRPSRAPPLCRLSSWVMYSSLGNSINQEITMEEWKQQAIEAFKKEVATLYKTRHENLVFFMGACMKPPLLAIVTQYCSGNTLYQELHMNRQAFSLIQCISIAAQVAKGMGYLHAKNIIHKDLKTKNIFIENKNKAVISDFGIFNFVRLSRRQKFGEYIIIPNGWLCYLSPEIIHSLDLNSIMNDTSVDLPFTKQSDVFAFGTVWYELLTMQWPFKNVQAECIIYLVGKGIKQSLQHVTTPRDFKEILNSCWSFRDTARPEFPALAQQLEKLPRLHRNPSHPVTSTMSMSHETLNQL